MKSETPKPPTPFPAQDPPKTYEVLKLLVATYGRKHKAADIWRLEFGSRDLQRVSEFGKIYFTQTGDRKFDLVLRIDRPQEEKE